MTSAKPSCSAMPHTTVRQFTRRRFGEQAAMTAMKQSAPNAAWTRKPSTPPSSQAAAAITTTSPMAANRSERPESTGGTFDRRRHRCAPLASGSQHERPQRGRRVRHASLQHSPGSWPRPARGRRCRAVRGSCRPRTRRSPGFFEISTPAPWSMLSSIRCRPAPSALHARPIRSAFIVATYPLRSGLHRVAPARAGQAAVVVQHPGVTSLPGDHGAHLLERAP